MPSSDLWDEEAAKRYDETSAEKFAPEVLGPTVDFLARLAGSGPALEFAIGTGRVSIPLAARGVPVTGIELSEPMVAQLRRKVDQGALPVVVGDMATPRSRASSPWCTWSGTASPTCAPSRNRSSASATLLGT